ncbi:hypothetical protein EJ02DRAFT_94881 [Clathrospora elynae]|uniref:SET domain-containing protein n=1 Tax=Clathrospora elynae TaxID=706981 RepID=A0A6A5SVL4_9PLEO|nr:hypothetical protein EJ02DRAFT_94881 [Clathrospora elynae]
MYFGMVVASTTLVSPTRVFTYSAGVGKGSFHAIKDIRLGEELAISYIRGAHLSKKRRQAIIVLCGFEWSCPSRADMAEAGIDHEARAKCEKYSLILEDLEKLGSAADWTRCQEICEKTLMLRQGRSQSGKRLHMKWPQTYANIV